MYSFQTTRLGVPLVFCLKELDIVICLLLLQNDFLSGLFRKNSPRMKLDLRHVQQTNLFTDIRPFSENDPKYYYQPLVKNLAGNYAFALEANRAQCPSSVVSFQFTTSTNHPIKTNFFNKLWIEPKSAKNKNKWKLSLKRLRPSMLLSH